MSLDRLYRDVENLKHQYKGLAGGPQLALASIENGNIDVNDKDGNLVSTIGLQEDGSGATRFFDGPIPPVPAGFTALADGPLIQGTWDGTFEDGAEATYDLAHLEVAATLVDDDTRATFTTITAKEGASASVVANQSGVWAVAVRSVSQAGKKSEFFSAGTVEVKLVDLAGAIEAVQDSANGKNKVHYSVRPPTPDDPGIFDDTWFVGQVGRPNDVVEATNLTRSPRYSKQLNQIPGSNYDNIASGGGGSVSLADGWLISYPGTNNANAPYIIDSRYVDVSPYAGKTFTAGVTWKLDAPMVEYTTTSLSLSFGYVNAAGTYVYSGPNSVQAPNAVGEHRVSVSFTVPADAKAFFVRAMNGSTQDTVRLSYVSFEEGTTTGEYFDGDTEDGATDNESHYRWTGEPHASMSEKYLPALNMGESDNWNVIEQYRHDGTGWVKVELSHYVFSTVDLGKATVGELDGIRIMARTIGAEQLRADFADFVVARGGTWLTTDGTGEWSDAGFFMRKPDGTSLVRFPTDGSPLSLTASDVQIDRAGIGDLDLANGSVRSGGVLTLASGVAAPASPPELTTGWNKTCTLETPSDYPTHSWVSLAYWSEGSGHWVRGVNVHTVALDNRDTIEVYDFATGVLQKRFSIGLNPNNGMTVIGDIVYVFGQGHGSGSARERLYIDGYDLNTGKRTSRHEYKRAVQAMNALGNDGTNLIIASVYNRELWVHRRHPVTGVQSGPDMKSGANSWPGADHSGLFGVNITGKELTVVPTVTARVYSIDGAVLTRNTDPKNAAGFAGWGNPNSDPVGYVMVAGAPRIVDSKGNVYRGSEILSDSTIQACFTWFDGTHETTPSPISTGTVSARNELTVSMPKRAGLQKYLYLKSSTQGSQWARHLVGEDVTAFVEGTDQVGQNQLPEVNTFPNATPATLKSRNGNIEFRGDGSGKIGPLSFEANGTMTGIPNMAAGTVIITPTAANTPTRVAVTFPSGKFSSPPIVVVSASTTVPGVTVTGTAVASTSATSFEAVVTRTNKTDTRVNWIAMEA
ncbi:hypothetical protein [Brevibacterium linens]|uniref:hypothetical protein n=1 Tax=Brevibacterium linens TaxID=1703 RepID=UPI003BF5353B